jgi:hypothetical protein
MKSRGKENREESALKTALKALKTVMEHPLKPNPMKQHRL